MKDTLRRIATITLFVIVLSPIASRTVGSGGHPFFETTTVDSRQTPNTKTEDHKVALSLMGTLCSLLGGWLLLCQYTHIPFRFRSLHMFIPRDRFFVFCLFSLVAKMTKADGRVTEEEMQIFRSFVNASITLSPFQERQAAIFFRKARGGTVSFQEVAITFVERFRREPAVLFTMLDLLLDLAAADPIVTAAEVELLDEFGRLIHISPHRLAAAKDNKFRGRTVEERTSREQPRSEQKDNFRGQTTPNPPHLDHAYRLLGCQTETPWPQIKSAYRELAKQHHPDRLKARGVPANMLRRATDHFRELKDAYELIRHERGER